MPLANRPGTHDDNTSQRGRATLGARVGKGGGRHDLANLGDAHRKVRDVITL